MMMPERVEGELVNRIFPFIFFSLITEKLATEYNDFHYEGW